MSFPDQRLLCNTISALRPLISPCKWGQADLPTVEPQRQHVNLADSTEVTGTFTAAGMKTMTWVTDARLRDPPLILFLICRGFQDLPRTGW